MVYIVGNIMYVNLHGLETGNVTICNSSRDDVKCYSMRVVAGGTVLTQVTTALQVNMRVYTQQTVIFHAQL